MKENYTNHPTVLLGKWIKDKRIDGGATLRKFANEIGMNICKYSEVERGLSNWLQIKHI